MILGMRNLLLAVFFTVTTLCAVTPLDALHLLGSQGFVNDTGEVDCQRTYSEKLYDSYTADEGLEERVFRGLGFRAYSPYDDVDYRGDLKRTDVEHIVSRAAAHRAGLCNAHRYKQAVRSFVTDPGNLTLASPVANRSKQDAGPADWLPSILSANPATQAQNRCAYAARDVRTRLRYGLATSRADYRALEKQLVSCESGYEWAKPPLNAF